MSDDDVRAELMAHRMLLVVLMQRVLEQSASPQQDLDYIASQIDTLLRDPSEDGGFASGSSQIKHRAARWLKENLPDLRRNFEADCQRPLPGAR